MNKSQFMKPFAVGGAFIFLCAAPGLTAQSGTSAPQQAPKAASPGVQPKSGSPSYIFEGLTYIDEQKAEIDQIHREIKANEDTVEKDQTLTSDQKDAMLQGYARLENSRIYKVLTPEQRRQVNMKIRARRAAEAAQKGQPLQN